MWYGIFISIAADITWDLVGTRCFELMLKFPYRLVHRDKLTVALCKIAALYPPAAIVFPHIFGTRLFLSLLTWS